MRPSHVDLAVLVLLRIETRIPAHEEVVAPLHDNCTTHRHVVLYRGVHKDEPWIEQLRIKIRPMVRPLAPITEDPRHSRVHVIEEVTVEEPILGLLVSHPLDDALAHRGNIHRVLQRRVISFAVQQPEEMPVQV